MRFTLQPCTPGLLIVVSSAWEMDPQSCVALRDKDGPEGCCTLVIQNSSAAKRPGAS